MYDTDSDNDAENCAQTGNSEEINVAMVVNAFIQTPIQSHDKSSLDSFEADIKLCLSQMSEIEASILIDSEKYKEECGTDSQMRRFNRKIKGCENSLRAKKLAYSMSTLTMDHSSDKSDDKSQENANQQINMNISSDNWKVSQPPTVITPTSEDNGSEMMAQDTIVNTIPTIEENGSESNPQLLRYESE